MKEDESKNISLENTFKEDVEDINKTSSNDNEIYSLNSLKNKQLKRGIKKPDSVNRMRLIQDIKNLKNDRTLKNNTLGFVKVIIMINIITTTLLLIGCPIIYFITGKQIYSEKFLGFLTGSQLIIMPLAILQIITKHLFPNKKENEK